MDKDFAIPTEIFEIKYFTIVSCNLLLYFTIVVGKIVEKLII